MNKKQIFPLSLTLLLIISILTFAVPVRGYAGTNLYADPASVTKGPTPVPIPGSYTFEIWMENATTNPVTTIAFDLDWDPTKVDITGITLSPALAMAGFFFVGGSLNHATGYVDDWTYGHLAGGKLLPYNLTCTVAVDLVDYTGPSGTVIDILGMSCWDTTLTEFLAGDSPYDHTVYILTPPPTPPTAKFTWNPLFPIEATSADFDATTSIGGFDGTNSCPITTYIWDFDDANQTTVGVPTIVHTFASAGSYDVNLTVIAPEGIGADPSYVNSSWVVHTVIVIAPALGRAIDLYTQDWRYPGYSTSFTGEGFPNGTQVDSYAPQDEVILYAKLTYNLEPIANKEVAFEIHGPANPYYNISLYRQAFTDECGIANISFRIPWPDVHAEEIVFGTWTALAKASVAEVTISDWHYFEVGWILTCGPIVLHDGTTPAVSFAELDTVYINVTVTNIALTDRNVTITAVIYDELGVPVGSAVLFVPDVPPGTSTYTLSITIPEWAYVGTGMVYVNLYTALPWDCGTCYGPECSTPIIIVRGPGC